MPPLLRQSVHTDPSPIARDRPLKFSVPDQASPFRKRRLGKILLSTGALDAAKLQTALELHDASNTRLGDVLVGEKFVSEDTLATGLALQQGVLRVSPLPERLDLKLIDQLGAAFCLRHRVLPWRQCGEITVVATSRPQLFESIRATMEEALGPVLMAVALEEDLADVILELDLDQSFMEASRTLRETPQHSETFQDGLVDSGSPFRSLPLGEILVQTGALVPANLDRALDLQEHTIGMRLGDILVEQRLIDEDLLASGLALQKGLLRVRPLPDRIDLGLVDQIGADICLRYGIIPWRRAGPVTVVATSRPQRFEDVRPLLEAHFGRVRMAVAAEVDLTTSLLESRADWLVARAETRPERPKSVRRWSAQTIRWTCLAGLAVLGVALGLAPIATFTALTIWTALCLAGATAMRAAALITMLPERERLQPHAAHSDLLPAVSLLVPLLREADISSHLIDRLTELDYPMGNLEICLVCEADDEQTEMALESRGLPPEFRVIVVPTGSIRTKPRALNYALDFCKGDIIGIYDAEDAPEPTQLRKVAARFATAPQDVVCLQGRLGFYNAGQNLLSRAFAIDYAAWFGVILPGLARLGFAIPLGGTGLFFRRAALEQAGRWDAHNVTEDADLGIRFARMGWRAEILDTDTMEEANCRFSPWIRQRSRWLKGYALTWAVHMANPRALWRDLGPLKFLGFQSMFLGTLTLFLMAPLLWSYWLLTLGAPHPIASSWSGGVLAGATALFLASLVLDLVIGMRGVRRTGQAWLCKWVPGMVLYFPLATLAAYRGLVDTIRRPYFWDKTAHGLSLETTSLPEDTSQHFAADDSQKRLKYAP